MTAADLTITAMPGIRLLRLHSLDSLSQLPEFARGLPQSVGESVGINPAILCLRNREWLLIMQDAETGDLTKRTLRNATDPQRTALLDVSDGYSLVRIGGSAGAWLLAKLCGLDCIGGYATTPHCAQTRMGDMAVIIHHHKTESESWVFDLLVDRSLANCLLEMLNDASPHALEMADRFGE